MRKMHIQYKNFHYLFKDNEELTLKNVQGKGYTLAQIFLSA